MVSARSRTKAQSLYRKAANLQRRADVWLYKAVSGKTPAARQRSWERNQAKANVLAAQAYEVRHEADRYANGYYDPRE